MSSKVVTKPNYTIDGGIGREDAARFTSWEVYSKAGYWAARGTVLNNSTDKLRFLKVCVDLKNSRGEIIDSGLAYVETVDTHLDVNQEASFHIWSWGVRPSAVASYNKWTSHWQCGLGINSRE